MINIWTILGVIAFVFLAISWNKRGAIWGGLTIGAIIGLIISVIYLFRGDGFNWAFILKGAVSGTMAGLFAELLGRMSGSTKKKREKTK